MAPSSLKKMSGVGEGKEGNNASSESSRYSDLGLTLLPGSQAKDKDVGVQHGLESRRRTPAKVNATYCRGQRGSYGSVTSYGSRGPSSDESPEALGSASDDKEPKHTLWNENEAHSSHPQSVSDVRRDSSQDSRNPDTRISNSHALEHPSSKESGGIRHDILDPSHHDQDWGNFDDQQPSKWPKASLSEHVVSEIFGQEKLDEGIATSIDTTCKESSDAIAMDLCEQRTNAASFEQSYILTQKDDEIVPHSVRSLARSLGLLQGGTDERNIEDSLPGAFKEPPCTRRIGRKSWTRAFPRCSKIAKTPSAKRYARVTFTHQGLDIPPKTSQIHQTELITHTDQCNLVLDNTRASEARSPPAPHLNTSTPTGEYPVGTANHSSTEDSSPSKAANGQHVLPHRSNPHQSVPLAMFSSNRAQFPCKQPPMLPTPPHENTMLGNPRPDSSRPMNVSPSNLCLNPDDSYGRLNDVMRQDTPYLQSNVRHQTKAYLPGSRPAPTTNDGFHGNPQFQTDGQHSNQRSCHQNHNVKSSQYNHHVRSCTPTSNLEGQGDHENPSSHLAPQMYARLMEMQSQLEKEKNHSQALEWEKVNMTANYQRTVESLGVENAQLKWHLHASGSHDMYQSLVSMRASLEKANQQLAAQQREIWRLRQADPQSRSKFDVPRRSDSAVARDILQHTSIPTKPIPPPSSGLRNQPRSFQSHSGATGTADYGLVGSLKRDIPAYNATTQRVCSSNSYVKENAYTPSQGPPSQGPPPQGPPPQGHPPTPCSDNTVNGAHSIVEAGLKVHSEPGSSIANGDHSLEGTVQPENTTIDLTRESPPQSTVFPQTSAASTNASLSYNQDASDEVPSDGSAHAKFVQEFKKKKFTWLTGHRPGTDLDDGGDWRKVTGSGVEASKAQESSAVKVPKATKKAPRAPKRDTYTGPTLVGEALKEFNREKRAAAQRNLRARKKAEREANKSQSSKAGSPSGISKPSRKKRAPRKAKAKICQRQASEPVEDTSGTADEEMSDEVESGAAKEFDEEAFAAELEAGMMEMDAEQEPEGEQRFLAEGSQATEASGETVPMDAEQQVEGEQPPLVEDSQETQASGEAVLRHAVPNVDNDNDSEESEEE